MHVVIVGGGAALAQPLIEHYLTSANSVTAVCRKTRHPIPGVHMVYDSADVEKLIDVVITLPGSTDNGRIVNTTDYQWQHVIDDTLVSVAKALSRLLSKVKNGGNVVVVGSIVGSAGGFGCANYAAAKAGLVGLVRAAANEEAHRDVCINLLELGYINMGMGARLEPKLREKIEPTIPLKRFGEVTDFVGAVDYLSKVRYMTGGILNLAGGLR